MGVVAIALLVLAAGVYKFNFTNDDIYVAGPDGKFIQIDEAEALFREIDDGDTLVLGTIHSEEFVQKWLAAKGGDARLIDVRTAGEYASGHYKGAELIDFYSADFATKLGELDKDIQYFIYCQSGNRSGQALHMMQELGFTKVYDLAGGIGGNGSILPIIK